MSTGYLLRASLVGVCFWMFCASSIADDKLSIKKLRSLEHQLVSAKNGLDAYRSFLTQSNVSQADRETAEARIRDLAILAEQGVWFIGGKKLFPKDIEAIFTQSEALIVEAIKLAELKSGPEAQKKMADASKLNRASFHADFLMGLHAASVTKDFQLARQYFEECVERGRALQAVWGPNGETNYLSALNNMALTKIRDDKLEESCKLWSEALKLRPKPPHEIAHNIVRTLRYMEFAKGGPVLKVTDGSLKKFRQLVNDLGSINEIKGLDSGWAYLGFSTGQTIGTYAEGSINLPAAPTIRRPEAELGTIFSPVIYDRACLMCDGREKITCDNECNKGVVSVDSFDEIADPFGGKRVPKKSGVRCSRCGGQGTIQCPSCSNGSEEINFETARSGRSGR